MLPLGEFTVTIPEPHATLHQCCDCATLQGVRIPSGILKIVFRHILFFFVFNAFDERRLSYRLRYTCFIGFFIYCSTVVSSGIVLHVFTRYGYITRYATMATPVQSLLLAA